jgi:Tfp pilus assembly protein FimT
LFLVGVPVARRRSAYTLFETVLVVALILVLVALAYPTAEAVYAHLEARAACDSVRGAWALARSRAMEEARPYRFAIIPNQGNYRVAPDTREYWAGETPTADPSGAVILTASLPPKIRFVSEDDPGGEAPRETVLAQQEIQASSWVPVAVFLPDGTAAEDAMVSFQKGGSRPIIMRLRALTGVATTSQ